MKLFIRRLSVDAWPTMKVSHWVNNAGPSTIAVIS